MHRRGRRLAGLLSVSDYWSIPEGVDPDWQGRRGFADELRRLARQALVAEGADWTALIASLKAVQLPEGRTSRQAWSDASYHDTPAKFTDRGAMMGRCNVIAPPLHPTFDDGTSTCRLTLDERYVGAPGMSHGGIVAAIFDQMLGHCVVMHDVGALTTELTIRYRRPVPLHRPVVFTAGGLSRDGRLVRLSGQCHDGETLLAEARAVFVQLKQGWQPPKEA